MSQGNTLLRTLTALLTVFALFALAGYQVTSATAGVRLLSRLSAALIEFDRWLPEHRDDLDLLARDRPTGFVRPDLPIPVSLPARQLIDASDDVHRALILNAMGSALYTDGVDAFSDETGASKPPGIGDPTYWTVNLLDEGAHGLWQVVLPVALLLLLLCLAGSLAGGRSPLTELAAGAGIAVAASLVVWLISGFADGLSSSAADKEIALIVHDGAWIGVRNGVAVLAGSLALIVFFRYANVFRLPLPSRTSDTSTTHSPDLSTPSDLPPY